ncbi:MAG: cytochrome c oxidase assembly protein [Sphingomonas sp.]
MAKSLEQWRGRFPGAAMLAPPGNRVVLAIFAVSLLLWWACRFHAAILPAEAPWEFSFSWFYATAFPLWWYFRGIARTPCGARPSILRTASFLLGVLGIYIVLQTRFEYLAEHMFFLNRFQHVVMHHLGPLLIALAWPWQTILIGMPGGVRRIAEGPVIGRILHIMRKPLLAALLFVGLIAFWLVPAIHFRAMIDPELYLAMNWTMVADGVLFWSLVLDPRPAAEAGISFGMRAALSAGVMFPQILIGAIIALSRTDLYAFYTWCGRIFPSVGAMDDQNYGGLIVWIPPAMMSVLGVLLVLNALRRSEEANAPAPRRDGSISASSWTGR